MANKQKALLADFSETVPMEYLHEKTQILIETEDGQLIRARTDMDGHAVSPNYGKRTGNNHFLDKEVLYINVVSSLQQVGGRMHENSSIYARNNPIIHVREFTHDLYLADLQREANEAEDAELAKKTAKREKVLSYIATAEKNLADAKKQLEGLTD